MSQSDSPTVSIQEGQLRGTVGENLDGEKFLKFFGIPYAEPPVNQLRFQPPQPVKPWEGVKDATTVGSASIGRDDVNFQIQGSEDCLVLNVYTKALPSGNSKLRPVMVNIHGGGLTMGSSRPGSYGPEFLMLKDIVLVTINYRLGALGFLSVDGTEVTGNMGLKDQTLALKWVQRNIKSFNGDPDNVTIFGESAGGASVHAHILSPTSKGLFHKGIAQSGCVLNPWFWGSKNNARELVKELGKTAETELEALEILRGVPGLELFNAQEKILDLLYPDQRRPFSAVLENQNESAFLSKNPRETMREGSYNHVPLMLGYTDTEGMVLDFVKKMSPQLPPFDTEVAIPFELNVAKGSPESTKIKEIMEKTYSKQPNEDHYDEITDGLFLTGIAESLFSHLSSAKKPIYFYRVSISTSLNRLKNAIQAQDKPGACHADDLGYLWNSDITPGITAGSLEDKSLRTFVELWTNFAEFGNPTPNAVRNTSWPPVESLKNVKLLDIGEQLQVKGIPERERVEMWRDIYNEFLTRK